VTAPIDAVLFDLHATLIDQGSPERWIESAAARLGMADFSLSPDDLAALRERLDRIWEHARTVDPQDRRDLDPAVHREVFTSAMADLPGLGPDRVEALYATLFDPWTAYDDTAPVLNALREHGKAIVLVSNVGLDVRPMLGRLGLEKAFDGIVLSYEIGAVKPEPEIFRHALACAGVPAERALMVGDSPTADAGAAGFGIRTLILPRTRGRVHGLDAVLRIVLDG